MASTGIYWLPLMEILEAHGMKVKRVNARHVKNLPGRKTDVLDCQWLQRLHSYGLLEGAFQPDQTIPLCEPIRATETIGFDMQAPIFSTCKSPCA